MSIQTIQTRSITEEDIARGIAAGRRARAVAVQAAFASVVASVIKPVVSMLAGTKSAATGGAHPAAV